jgi:hypothetical protein
MKRKPRAKVNWQEKYESWQKNYLKALTDAGIWRNKFEKSDSALKEELLRTSTLQAEVERLKAENEKEVTEFKKDLSELKAGLLTENRSLLADLAHSDAERRKLERDVLAQRAELARLQPFNIRIERFAENLAGGAGGCSATNLKEHKS